MQRATLVEARGGGVYGAQLADAMLRLFEAHGFRGHLPGLGHNAQALSLTLTLTLTLTLSLYKLKPLALPRFATDAQGYSSPNQPQPEPLRIYPTTLRVAQAPLLTKLRGGLRSWQSR